MNNQSGHSLHRFIWVLAPATLVFLLFLFMAAIAPYHAARLPVPMLPLIALFYWQSYRPEMMPILLIFALGLSEDVLNGTPLGSSALIYLLSAGMIRLFQNQLANMAFAASWMMFILIAAGAEIGFWVVHSLHVGIIQPPLPYGLQWGFTFLLYPVLHIIFSRWFHASAKLFKNAQ